MFIFKKIDKRSILMAHLSPSIEFFLSSTWQFLYQLLERPLEN